MPGGGIQIGTAWIGLVPVISILLTLLMIAPVLGDVGYKASHGDWIPASILIIYVIAGALFYRFYGMRHSRLGKEWHDRSRPHI